MRTMSSLPDLPPPDESSGKSPDWLSDSTLEMRRPLATRMKFKVRTAKLVKNIGSSAKHEKLSTGSAAKREKLSTGSSAKLVKKMKKEKIDNCVPHVRRHVVGSWRFEAKPDLSEVARVFGADLGSLEAMQMGIEEAKNVFQEQGVPVGQLMTADVERPHVRECLTNEIGTTFAIFWEIFAGSCNLTKVVAKECQKLSATGDMQTAVLPPVEIDQNKLSSTPWKGLHTWDVLLPSQRRLVWAYLALLQPSWVHLGPPCTFWSPLARRCNLRSDAENEHLRLKALAFLVFSLQVCNFQRQHQRYWSLEQPPHCASWNLDILKEFTERELATGNAALKFDSCARRLGPQGGATMPQGPRERQTRP